MRPRMLCAKVPAALVVLIALAITPSTHAIVSSTAGLNINNYLGANTFYTAGYDGSGAVVANIEAGNIWTGHATLGHATTLVNGVGALGEVDRHATWVGQAIGGRTATNSPVEMGIAPGADLWSGAIATSWVGSRFALSFNISYPSLFTTYQNAMQVGVGGKTADVINSSWGYTDPAAVHPIAIGLDALAYQTPKTVVFSSGNGGPAANTVGAPGSAYNNITVAALGPDTGSNPYSAVSGFSGRGPSAYANPTSPTTYSPINGVRAAVDIAAPGQSITLAYYGGETGGNSAALGGSPSGAPGTPTTYTPGLNGTSFAAPIVAGGATLLADVGHDLFALNPAAIDGRVIKAVLMNSADKTPGWNNGQSTVSGVVTTTQSLDWAVGAGRMNLDQAFEQYTFGTTDVLGLGGGGVNAIGWDYGQVSSGVANDYLINPMLVGGSTFQVTLDWFVDRQADLVNYSSFSERTFDNLDLEVWLASGGSPTTLVARSNSLYNNVEHLSFTLPYTAQYLIRVLWTGELYDFVNAPNSEAFGLAWFGAAAVPEPISMALWAIGMVGLLAARRRRRSRSLPPAA